MPATHAAVEKEVSSRMGILEIVDHLQCDEWFFRGQRRCKWDLTTTMDRCKPPEATHKDCSAAEWDALDVFKKDAIRYRDFGINTNWISTMQHYGAATRLLDFTESLMVALYFAFEGADADAHAHAPCIWCIRQKPIWMNLDHYEHHRFCEDDDIGDRVSTEMFISRSQAERNLQSLNYINRLIFNPSCIPCLDASEPEPRVVPVYPSHMNDRISAQNGLFLAPTNLGRTFQENLFTGLDISSETQFLKIGNNLDEMCEAYLIKLVFTDDARASCRDLLKVANVSAKGLFPGLEGIARACQLFPSRV